MSLPETDTKILDHSRSVLRQAHHERPFARAQLQQGLSEALDEADRSAAWRWMGVGGMAVAAAAAWAVWVTEPELELEPRAIALHERMELAPGTWRVGSVELDVKQPSSVVWVQEEPIRLRLDRGLVEIRPLFKTGENEVIVTTPQTTVHADQAVFRVEVLAHRVALSVQRGAIEVESKRFSGGRKTLKPGKPLVLTQPRKQAALTSPEKRSPAKAGPPRPKSRSAARPPRLVERDDRETNRTIAKVKATAKSDVAKPEAGSRSLANEPKPEESQKTAPPKPEVAESKAASKPPASETAEATKPSKSASAEASKVPPEEPANDVKAPEDASKVANAPKPLGPEGLMERADKLRRSGDLNRAVTEYARVVRSKGPALLREEAAYHQSEILHRLKKSDRALAVLRQADRSHPGGHLEPERAALAGQILFERGRLNEALKVLARIERPPLEIYQLRLRIAERLSKSDPQQARRVLNGLLKAPLPPRLKNQARALLKKIDAAD